MTYTHLVSITQPNSKLHIKEWLDIALVSASYDISVALFIDSEIVTTLKENPCIDIEQSFNMLKDFDVPLFSQNDGTLYGQKLTASPLTKLETISKHHFTFPSSLTLTTVKQRWLTNYLNNPAHWTNVLNSTSVLWIVVI